MKFPTGIEEEPRKISSGTGNVCFNCGDTGHNGRYCPIIEEKQRFDRKNVQDKYAQLQGVEPADI